jgi:hypothetical protein
MWRGAKVGRISYDHKPYAGEEHARWRWFLNDTHRNRMANGRCATREEAMAAFREAFDRVPDNTVDSLPEAANGSLDRHDRARATRPARLL